MDKFLNEIICGDCIEVMKDMPDKCISMALTSPPYGTLRDYKGYTFDFEGIANQLFRVIKKGGVLVWVVGDQVIDGSESGTSFRQALYFKEVGFNLHDTMIYQRRTLPHKHSRYEQEFEYMFVLTKSGRITFNPIMRRKIWKENRTTKVYGRESDGEYKKGIVPQTEDTIIGNIWAYNVGGGHCGDSASHDHPAIFPEQLAKDHIISWSNPNDIVLDPMCGSGTTCKMAKLLGRRYIGIDISEDYCEIARERLEAVETGVPVKETRKGQIPLFK
jgi:site-specific DNA-methyltransferase (adenine-specific)